MDTFPSPSFSRSLGSPTDVVARQTLSLTHMVALVLILPAAVLLEHSVGETSTSTAPWVLLCLAALVAVVGRRWCRHQLIAQARQVGLSEADAKLHARRQMSQLTQPLQRRG